MIRRCSLSLSAHDSMPFLPARSSYGVPLSLCSSRLNSYSRLLPSRKTCLAMVLNAADNGCVVYGIWKNV